MLSIIIPTLNEEENIGNLLQSLVGQTRKDFEVIVVDAKSKDNTESIVKRFSDEFDIKIVYQPGKGVANARNHGATLAKYDLLLFLDADVVLKNYFIESAVAEFNRRKLGAASVYMRPRDCQPCELQLEKKAFDKVTWQIFFNTVIGLAQYVYPGAVGVCIFCKKEIHDKIKGFDETITLAEDFEYVGRAAKLGKFRLLRRSVYVSVRRADMEGRLRLLLKYILAAVYKIFVGEMRANEINYKFGHYGGKRNNKNSRDHNEKQNPVL